MLRPLIVLFSLLLLVSTSYAATPLTLIYSGNLDGELEPCGCTLDTDYGGILRRAYYIDSVRDKAADKMVLISSGGLFSKELAGDQIKNNYILAGLAQLNYDAVGVQWADLTHGVEFLNQVGLPFTASNWISDELPRSQTITRDKSTLFFTQWLDPKISPYQSMPGLSPISANIKNIEAQLDKADKAGQLTILATTLPLTELEQQLDLSVVDILLIKSAYEQFGEPLFKDGTLILQPGSRGQRLGQLELSISAQGNLSDWSHKVIELSATVPDAQRLLSWYEDYNEALRVAFEKEMKLQQELSKGETPYVGEQVCGTCHQSSHDSWQDSEHAKAFEDLEEVGKAYDPHCVSCHVVGYKKPGGFLSIELSSQLAGVQCENCHGEGKEHVESGGQSLTPNHGLPKEQICTQCHVPEHSPKFNVTDYWPKILHGKEPSATDK